MATESQPVGPYDYLASGLEKSLNIISQGRADARQRREKVADTKSEEAFRTQQTNAEIALRKSMAETDDLARAEQARLNREADATRQAASIAQQQNEATARATQAGIDSTWRQNESDARRKESAQSNALSLRNNAITTGVLPTENEYMALGLDQPTARTFVANTKTAREDYINTDEYKRKVAYENSRTASMVALGNQRNRLPSKEEAAVEVGNLTAELLALPATPDNDSARNGLREKIIILQGIATGRNFAPTEQGSIAPVLGTNKSGPVTASSPRPSGNRTSRTNANPAIVTQAIEDEATKAARDLQALQSNARAILNAAGGVSTNIPEAQAGEILDGINAAKARVAAAEQARESALPPLAQEYLMAGRNSGKIPTAAKFNKLKSEQRVALNQMLGFGQSSAPARSRGSGAGRTAGTGGGSLSNLSTR